MTTYAKWRALDLNSYGWRLHISGYSYETQWGEDLIVFSPTEDRGNG